MTDKVIEMAPKILELIKKSKKILLHCHPYPDADSIGSVLAMTLALKKMGLEVTSILGDSEYPDDLIVLPHHDLLVKKNYSEIDTGEFDLFIILDSSTLGQVSRLAEVKIPKNMKTVVIDHHVTNLKYGDINLVDETYTATSQIIYDLFIRWGVEVDKDMAVCLFLGLYTDSGGFKYPSTTANTLAVGAELAKINPDFPRVIFEMENAKDPQEIAYEGLALSSIEKYFSGKLVMAAVPYEKLKEKGIQKGFTQGGVGNTLISVIGWEIGINFVEADPGVVLVSFRTRNSDKHDVSLIASMIGKGGGHKAAAGTTIYEPFEVAKKQLLETIAKTFPDLGKI
ncbi:MAG: DHH family/DHHA1 domain protein [Candidatus Collierbacteria bacterium GW2011_GWA1_42_60]|uniref:DHH family/DHHA1 domain protein n=1 Tax=Candidatus Collierbacteria bacterium GW2011_GWA2_42_17 TaxID=1618378 RepID=A0A0G0Z1Q3_9BACT|nr:MAG: DHH family/DHHA1 domain protein [Candidatus Collierbacteria bacterium GW2011_GWB2_42_12]KKS42689.1 MAG: DHH family/DHHA1 domain protein [Candidatus Collierbacteria bacterium GW2011_GWA2_42_17]KKS61865.1 MAG: DHH family/DHHA1 domain protein [Candidatus Collierbacteria bacterium GW2011_GWE2_42_48]KKS63220.1 MAG: DHH family/DHHA1 domain protein [Candidatus Collierbacteria bacterium GW2011_GWD2_42_50]KKS67423.1 MAG: DHH family/DHHA1 domain protein [Candidatus Collierbacteria bacterium GW201